jgi:hypothetical protein
MAYDEDDEIEPLDLPCKVEPGANGDWYVDDANGELVYDLIDDEQEARDICAVLNRGIGPDWETVSPEVEKRRKRRKASSKRKKT